MKSFNSIQSMREWGHRHVSRGTAASMVLSSGLGNIVYTWTEAGQLYGPVRFVDDAAALQFIAARADEAA